MSASDLSRQIVRLDVGGTLYKTSRDTLARFQGSMLANLISDRWNTGSSSDPIFIDRNGRLFEYVLDYLRASEVYLPSGVNRGAIQKEFEFFGIDADISQVHDKNEKESNTDATAAPAAETQVTERERIDTAVQVLHLVQFKVLNTHLRGLCVGLIWNGLSLSLAGLSVSLAVVLAAHELAGIKSTINLFRLRY